MRWQSHVVSTIGVLVIGAVLGLFTGVSLNLPALPPAEAPVKEASIMIDDGRGAVKVLRGEPAENETLFAFTQRLLDAENIDFTYKEDPDSGALVEGIGKVKNSRTLFWQAWVNNDFAPGGGNASVVKPGDVIEWQYLKEPPGS